MSEKKLDNKYVEVDGNGYRLTIQKELNMLDQSVYVAYLSSIESPFSAQRLFRKSSEIQAELKEWIVKMDELNNSEDVVFDRLHEWDGVIEV